MSSESFKFIFPFHIDLVQEKGQHYFRNITEIVYLSTKPLPLFVPKYHEFLVSSKILHFIILMRYRSNLTEIAGIFFIWA